MRKELRFSGFGGQGVILMGHIFGKAAVFDGKNVTLTQSYGPEARGGACSVDIIVSDSDIHYPEVRKPDILISMSQPALKTYLPTLTEDGVLFIDTSLVEQPDRDNVGIPATELAEEVLGIRIVSNIIMLGYFTAITELVTEESMKKAISGLVPKGTEEKNLKAFQVGFEEGKK